MKVVQTWSDKVQDISGVVQPIYDVNFTFDGVYLIAAAGNEILVYEAASGQLVKALKGHKEPVTCLCPLIGNGFASGGADKQVIIWSGTFQGTLKYSHGDSIQAVAQNPITGVVLSCTASDFGLWSPDVKAVPKTKVNSRILCASWTADGQQFALGHYDGHISIRSSSGEEQVKIEKTNAPIWSLTWSTSKGIDNNILVAADWNQKLSYFQSNGRQIGKDRPLEFDPCSVSYFGNGEYIVLGGSDKEVNLWTAEGIKIGSICQKEGWIWACKPKQNQPIVAVGSADGYVSVYEIQFDTVQAIYRDRFAFRQNMTDIIVRNLTTQQQSKIPCRSHIKKTSIYKHILAVQTSSKVFIYESFKDDLLENYRLRDKINKTIDCNILVATSQKLLVAKDSKLKVLSFDGETVHEWNFESTVNCVKVIGGPKGSEGILVGLKGGDVIKLFVDNQFPISIVKHNFPVVSLDLNLNRQLLALVDESSNLLVYNMISNQLLFQESNAYSVAWNMELEDSLSFAGNGQLYIKVGQFPAQPQPFNGVVVGFKGSTVFGLQGSIISKVNVSQSGPLASYVDACKFDLAYQIACLGVTSLDWKKLARSALELLEFEVAEKAYMRIREFRGLEILKSIKKLQENPNKGNSELMAAEISAYTGKYNEAASLYKKSGNLQKAVEMYTDLNLWEAATQLMQENNEDPHEILKRKAQIQADRNDVLSAATTYEEVGDLAKAIELLGEGGWIDRLNQLVLSKLTPKDEQLLNICIQYFKSHKKHNYAVEAAKKMGDYATLVQIYVEQQNWEEAFKIGNSHPQFHEKIYLPYGQWLALNDRYEEAMIYYAKAGRPAEAIKVLKFLAENSVTQFNFKKAAYYYHCLCRDLISQLQKRANISQKIDPVCLISEWETFHKYAEIYFAYDKIYKYVEDPFTMSTPEALMNSAKFILGHINKRIQPPNISKRYTLYCLAKVANSLKCYKTCRYAYEKLMQTKLPMEWQDTVDLATLLIRSKPMTDPEEVLPICAQCSTINPFLNPKDLVCGNCLEPFVFSFHSFENLPLVQFVAEPGISEDECLQLLMAEQPVDAMNDVTFSLPDLLQTGSEKYAPISFNRSLLERCDPQKVFIQKFGCDEIKNRYYLQKEDSVSIVKCESCQKFFLEDEWNYQVLMNGKCPFCLTETEISG